MTASNIRQGYIDYTREEYISEDEYATRLSRGETLSFSGGLTASGVNKKGDKRK